VDRIELPPERALGHPDAYLRTALHELGHWTGHPRRLDRDTLNRGDREGRGSDAWAREEPHAEIASMMAGDRLGLGHDPDATPPMRKRGPGSAGPTTRVL
jgi:antirestriction protein ArdC